MSARGAIARIKVTLKDVEPAVTRRLDVPLRLRLDRLHLVLQAAIGWTDSHLYAFSAGDAEWGVPDPEFRDGARSAAEATLRDAIEGAGATTIHYLYDFGDGWDHAIRDRARHRPRARPPLPPAHRPPRALPARGRGWAARLRRLPHSPRRPRARGPRAPSDLGRRRLRPRRPRPRGHPRGPRRPRPEVGAAAAQAQGRPAILTAQPGLAPNNSISTASSTLFSSISMPGADTPVGEDVKLHHRGPQRRDPAGRGHRRHGCR